MTAALKTETVPAPTADSPGGGAPVILTTDDKGLAPLFRFMGGIAPEKYNALAQAEAARLQPYFEALSRHLRHDLQENPDLFQGKRDRMEKLTAPGNLSRLFTEVAAQTNKVMLSEIVIAPSTIYDDNALSQRVFGERRPYSSSSRYGDRKLVFGFDKLYAKDVAGNTLSESDFAILALDNDMLKPVVPHGPERMLRALQAINTLENHDMVHHIHMDDNVPQRFLAKKPPGYHMNDPRDVWLRNFDRDFSDQTPKIGDIESWLVMHHAKTLEYMDGAPLREDIKTYFDELQRMSAILRQQALASSDPAAALKAAHETVDYFNTIMGVSLLRFLPLNHHLLAEAFAGMEAADPAPEIVMQKNEATRDALSDHSMSYRYCYRDIFDNYAAEGHTVVDRNAKELSYAQIKLLELINRESMVVQLISKANPRSYLGEIQKKTARIGLEMIDAMARMTDFNPA